MLKEIEWARAVASGVLPPNLPFNDLGWQSLGWAPITRFKSGLPPGMPSEAQAAGVFLSLQVMRVATPVE